MNKLDTRCGLFGPSPSSTAVVNEENCFWTATLLKIWGWNGKEMFNTLLSPIKTLKLGIKWRNFLLNFARKKFKLSIGVFYITINKLNLYNWENFKLVYKNLLSCITFCVIRETFNHNILFVLTNLYFYFVVKYIQKRFPIFNPGFRYNSQLTE